MTITIRPARPDDLPRIKARTKATLADHRDRAPYAFGPDLWERELEPTLDAAFRDLSTGAALDSSPVLWVAESEGKAAGHMLLSLWAAREPQEMPSVTIEDIGVDADQQGTGVGRALVDHAKSLAAQGDWDNLIAQVWAGNAASAALFEAAGFAPQSQNYRFGPDRAPRPYPVRPRQGANWGGWINGALLVVCLGIFVLLALK